MEDFDFDTTVENIPSIDIPLTDIASDEDFDTTMENPPSNEDEFNCDDSEQNILKQIDRKIVCLDLRQIDRDRDECRARPFARI